MGEERDEQDGKAAPCVLVVEDDPLVRRTLVRLMSGKGWKVRETGRVDHALRALREEKIVSLVLLDVRLGDQSAVGVAAAAARKTPAPAVVAISGSATPEEAFELGRYGVRAFVPKVQLVAKLDQLLALAKRVPPLEPVVKAQVGARALKETQDTVRYVMLDEALALEQGSQAGAARRLGLTRQAVQQLMQRRGKA
ncbi:MAG TPA: response regulator [Sandaracinaceae bacterium]